MSLMQKSLQMAAGKMPKIINPTTHAVIDYAVAGSFVLMGAMFWSRNKRAAISSFICGGAAMANSMVTDYPGGVFRKMSFRNHGRIDAGLAGVTAALPKLMGFDEDREAKFFGFQALAETGVVGLTDFDYYEHSESHEWRHRREAGAA